jgi:alpha-glucosidase
VRHLTLVLGLAVTALGCSTPSNETPGADAQADATPDAVTALDALEDQPPFQDLATDLGTDAAGHEDVLPDTAAETDGSGSCPDGLPGFVTALGDGGFLVEQAGWDLHLQVLSEGIVRLRWLDAGTPPEPDLSYAVVPQEMPEAAVEASGDAACETLLLDTGLLQVTAGVSGVTVAQGGAAPFHVADGWPLRDALSGEVRQAYSISPADHYYGFGEKTGGLDKNGRTLTFWNFDPLAWGDYTTESEPIYQSIPAYVGLRDGVAFGVFTDNTRHMVFDVGDTDPEVLTITAADGVVDQYVYAGPTVPEVVERYTRLTGRPALPPRWTLGYHQCRWSYTPDTRVQEVCDQFRARGIPADGIWLDIDYMDGFRSFTFHPQDFSDPAGLVASLEAIGFKTTVIIDPGIKEDAGWDVYDAGLAGGHFITEEDGVTPFVGEVWPGPAVFPDFSKPGARDWWAGLVGILTDVGIRGVWIDMNEPTSFLAEDDHTVPDHLPVDWDGLGETMGALHNVYAHLMARATREGLLEASTRRPFVLTRAGYAGQQRYTAMWTGDSPSNFPMMAANLPMMLGLGLSGVVHCGSDVGGFSGAPGPELFARWMQLGSISPFFRGHVATGTPDQEPWSFTLEVEDISRNMIAARYRLLPYYYSLFREAAMTGAPILRPLLWHFQDDDGALTIGDQAMIGPWILAAPVLAPDATFRNIHLPPGRWFEYHSGRLHAGPGTLVHDVTLGALPLYVREGAILPHGPLMMWSDQAPLSPLRLDIYPADAETSFTLFEDDGDSMSYETGAYAEVTYTTRRTDSGAILTASPRTGTFVPPSRTLVVRVRRVDFEPTAVTLDGAPLPHLESMELTSPPSQGWAWDPRDLSLAVAFGDQAGFELVMTYTPTTLASPNVEKRFIVTLPPGTPADAIHIAGTFNDWAQLPMQPGAEPGTAEALVSVPRGEWFWYKYTRGSWETVEKWAGCEEALDRYEFGAAHPDKLDDVTMWADDLSCGE